MLLKHERNNGLGMDALVIVCSWNTNGTMVWAWRLWSPYALGTRTGLALVTVCSWNTNGTMVWAWRLWSPYARTELWFGHGCSGHRMLLEHERNYGLGMDALFIVCSWNTNGTMVWAWRLWLPYTLGTRTELWFGHGGSGHRMPLEHERNYGLGMEALVTLYSWNTNGIMVRAWMLWSPYALGPRTELWFGHGGSGHRMLLEHERNYGLGMEALVTVCSWTRMELWFGHGGSGHRMLFEHERNYGLGMEALVTVCSWNTNGTMVWAWRLWSPYALGHEWNYGLGMEALVTVCSWTTNGIMVWAWML